MNTGRMIAPSQRPDVWGITLSTASARARQNSGPKDKDETIAGHRVHACLEGTLLIDPMLRLYLATGDQRYMQWSQWVVANIDRWSGYNTFSKLDQVAQGKMGVHELLSGRGIHAHTLHMNLLGLLRLYQITGDESLLRKVQGIWRDIAEHHAYITGGVSSDEGYRAAEQPPLTGKEVETCSTMSWIQLSQYLLELTEDPAYADMIERALWNHLFAAQAIDGESFRYFTPLNGTKPGGYFPSISPNCCTASGPRMLSMLPGLIYAQSEQDLYVNQFVDSTVNFDQVTLTQTTNYPSNGTVTFQIQTQQTISFTLNIRLPSWCPNPTLNINGQVVSDLRPGTYAQLKRQWKADDRVTLTLPMQPQWAKRTRQDDDKELWALTRGPLVYAVDTVRWETTLAQTLGNVPKAIQLVDVHNDLNTVTTPPRALGPAYQVTIALPNDERADVTMLPFANVGQWYQDAEHKPDPKGESYGYAIWLQSL